MTQGYAIGKERPSRVSHLKVCGKLPGRMHQMPSVSSSSGRPTRSTSLRAPWGRERGKADGDDGAAEVRGDAGHLHRSPARALAHHVAVEAVQNALVRQLETVVE